MKPLRFGAPRLGTPRLLPIVIFASVALLGFKGIGLITGSGYVLAGTARAQAAEAPSNVGATPPTAADTSASPSVADSAPRTEPTAADTAPTLADTTPTLVPAAAPAGETGAEKAPAGGAADADAAQGSNSTAVAVGGAGGAPATDYTVCAAEVSNPGTHATGMDAAAAAGKRAPQPGINCDATAYRINDAGDATPLLPDDGTAPTATEQTLLSRLGQRRAELDKRAADLQVQEATLKAAEQQLQVRTDALKALEARIQQMDDERKAANDAQFGGIVKMYETMKPQDAAAIFNGLDMAVLTRVARAMDPRKMSAVLAKMSAARAQELTIALANPIPGVLEQNTTAALDTNTLPQIVGH